MLGNAKLRKNILSLVQISKYKLSNFSHYYRYKAAFKILKFKKLRF